MRLPKRGAAIIGLSPPPLTTSRHKYLLRAPGSFLTSWEQSGCVSLPSHATVPRTVPTAPGGGLWVRTCRPLSRGSRYPYNPKSTNHHTG
eukprot:10348257-Heterocapsa_arctica.AAC.1